MLETLAIPLLTQAIDFLFVESSKILEERRERRKKEGRKVDSEKDSLGESLADSKEKSTWSRDQVLQLKVGEADWKRVESQVASLLRQKESHVKNYNFQREKIAKLGFARTDMFDMNQLIYEEEQIIKVTKELQEILSEVYGKRFTVIDEVDLKE